MLPFARDGLDAVTVRRMLADPWAQLDTYVEVLDQDLQLQGTVKVEPVGSNIIYAAEQTVPLRCRLVLTEAVTSTALLRPVRVFRSRGLQFTAQRGVYRPATPIDEAGETPRRYEVDGYDLTAVLDQPHGATVRIGPGESYVALAQSIAEGYGLTVSIAGAGDAKTAERERIWPFDANTTARQITTELLAEPGYDPLRMAPSGVVRSQPARDPANRGAEDVYDAQSHRTRVAPTRRRRNNVDDRPTILMGVSTAAMAWDPVSGDGIHVIQDVDAVAAGIIRRQVAPLDAVDQEELVAATEREWAQRRRIVETYEFGVLPNPLHWSDPDVVDLRDSELGTTARVMVTGWTEEFAGDVMPITAVTL